MTSRSFAWRGSPLEARRRAVIRGDQLDPNTAQTPGMFRQAAINHARVGAQKIWAGTVSIAANAKTGVHHHGELESVIYVVQRARRGCAGASGCEFVAEAGPGDFIFVPPFVPHQEINADPARRWNACWCAPTTRRWWSTSPTSIRSKSRRRSTGSTRSTNIREGRRAPSNHIMPSARRPGCRQGERSTKLSFPRRSPKAAR